MILERTNEPVKIPKFDHVLSVCPKQYPPSQRVFRENAAFTFDCRKNAAVTVEELRRRCGLRLQKKIVLKDLPIQERTDLESKLSSLPAATEEALLRIARDPTLPLE
jgi:hypothetical protein